MWVSLEADKTQKWFEARTEQNPERAQHFCLTHESCLLSEEIRASYGLSQDLYKRSDYDRLTLSLISPLPNEQDFAVNVCTLLSNEGKHTLKLAKCPRLLDLLLSHAGVYQHRKFYKFLGRAGRGHSLFRPGGLRSNPSGRNIRRYENLGKSS